MSRVINVTPSVFISIDELENGTFEAYVFKKHFVVPEDSCGTIEDELYSMTERPGVGNTEKDAIVDAGILLTDEANTYLQVLEVILQEVEVPVVSERREINRKLLSVVPPFEDGGAR